MYPLNMTHEALRGHAVANDEAEHRALSAMGYEPAFVSPETAEASEADEAEELRAQLKAKGIDFDGRWGIKRLREALGA